MFPDNKNIITFAEKDDVRCPNCKKLLLRQRVARGIQEIVCVRCGFRFEIVDGNIKMIQNNAINADSVK
ncbi:MAG: hypothetical protein FWF54_03585 [Candidatus Azobacteroides sp.]|nr:hypothetical protein [Candidatus Azobacteroides sp.]